MTKSAGESGGSCAPHSQASHVIVVLGARSSDGRFFWMLACIKGKIGATSVATTVPPRATAAAMAGRAATQFNNLQCISVTELRQDRVSVLQQVFSQLLTGLPEHAAMIQCRHLLYLQAQRAGFGRVL
eukprot:CAMPEP_0178444258 /NCGR_PEP_ID=MMETSP0689_2-20121128/39386_1 /TAXON_ID=160604 /ORGANISM="Amphidinium massartii, Strain CS-259" /LENGTH=127 /DNA_ID=CAMNT_0020068427 /DNA_START=170 /DNA_END=554 /DNA_ORIENTATION=+